MPSVAVVVGSGAIAAAIAERLGHEGLKVGAVGRGVRQGDLTIDTDLTSRDAMKAAADTVARELGSPAVLVMAPEHDPSGRFGTMAGAQWQNLLRDYLGTTVAAAAAFVPAMVERRRGCVVTMSSRQALTGAGGDAYLAAAAGTILGFTKSFALELARHGVRVNCIAVGPPHPVRPAEIADTAAFLVQAGGFYVGQVLTPGLAT